MLTLPQFPRQEALAARTAAQGCKRGHSPYTQFVRFRSNGEQACCASMISRVCVDGMPHTQIRCEFADLGGPCTTDPFVRPHHGIAPSSRTSLDIREARHHAKQCAILALNRRDLDA